MYSEQIFDHEHYRARMNPEFVRAVLAKRKAQEAAAEADRRKRDALTRAEKRAAERKRAREAQAEAAARIEAAKAELGTRQIVVYRMDGGRFQHTYSMIEARAMRLFRMTRVEIRSNRRDREIVFARQFIMYWTARLTQHSLPLIGRLMGGRDHTTILHGKRAYVEKRARMGRSLKP